MVVEFLVFKKSCPNGKITIFLPKRDFVERSSLVEPIEGVLLVDPNYVGDRKVFLQLTMRFRFGNEEDELAGVSFMKTLYIDTHQVYPQNGVIISGSDTQMKLVAKLGTFAYPFILNIPLLGGPSYSMQRRWNQDDAVLGMEYEVMAFVGYNDTDIRNRNSCKLSVRKIQEIPRSLIEGKKPHGTITKTILPGMGTITIDCTLSNQVYGPGACMQIIINVQNKTKKQVKMLKVKVIQKLECPFLLKKKCQIQTISKVNDNIQLEPGSSRSREFSIMVYAPTKPKYEKILLQSQFDKDAKDELATSTIFSEGVHKEDIFGIVVSYALKVKAIFGGLQGDVILNVPFTVKAS